MTAQTRVRIKNGQKVAEIQTPAIRGNGWNKTGEHYSADDHAALGWLIPVYAEIPIGAVAHVVEWQREILQMEVIIDGKVAVPMIYGNHAIQIVHEYWTAEEIAAQNAEAEAEAQAIAAAGHAAYIAAIAPTAQIYGRTLRIYFPDMDPPAEQNQNATEAAVSAYFVGRRMAGDITPTEVADSMILANGFAKLKGPDGTTWSLPWADIWKVGA